MKELCPTPAFTMNPPVMNQHDATHDEMNYYMLVLQRFLCSPVHHLLFHTLVKPRIPWLLCIPIFLMKTCCMLVVFEIAATSVVFMVIKLLIVMLLVVHQPHSSKRLLQIPFPPQLPLFTMPIQPHLFLFLKVRPVSRPLLSTGVNHIVIRVSVNTANVLAIVQPIAMIVNVHPVMMVMLFLVLAIVLLHHLLMLLLQTSR
jgi:hypothetical protein